ncbi:hypothetical protein [Halonotius aquaticus]|uniref:hypothetical protein n=1 Tax=Halonotius aquaticus TaxID=2216978 RepID=UPI00197A7F7E|nr:hypothetical protein [Halonotius aquaticus]
MRIQLPTNRLVAMTLAGALLTMVVAGGLVFPGLGLTSLSDGDTGITASDQQTAGDAPQPNENFTPAVQTGGDGKSGDGEYEDEEDGEYEDEEDGEYGDEEDDEYEDEEDEEEEYEEEENEEGEDEEENEDEEEDEYE